MPIIIIIIIIIIIYIITIYWVIQGCVQKSGIDWNGAWLNMHFAMVTTHIAGNKDSYWQWFAFCWHDGFGGI